MSQKTREEGEQLFAAGHRACPGCGAAIAARLILMATGPQVIVVTPTGCLETFAGRYMESPWQVPWIHPLFENGPAVASGVAAALRVQGRAGQVKVVAIGGDGATFDIGLASLSGLLERDDDVTYICYDNEGYMNTGVQRSSATPYRAWTSTTPVGACSLGEGGRKKDLPAIAAAHGIPYVATASIAYPHDLMHKVRRALAIRGAKYIQVHSPCCLGWGFDPSRTVEVARLGVETGLVALYELENGRPGRVHRLAQRRPVEEYLRAQTRFRHLFQRPEGTAALAEIQAMADQNALRFGLDRVANPLSMTPSRSRPDQPDSV